VDVVPLQGLRQVPAHEHPDFFTGWASIQEFVDALVKTNCIIDGGQIWWDVRPHHTYETLEYRICDIPLRADETVTIAALFQAITAKLWLAALEEPHLPPYRRSLIMENKWRARAVGDSRAAHRLRQQAKSRSTDLLEELLEFVDDVVDELGTRQQIQYVREIVDGGTGASASLRFIVLPTIFVP
jgi:carboxylate-amine ligase